MFRSLSLIAFFTFGFSINAEITAPGGPGGSGAGPASNDPQVKQACDVSFIARLSLASMYGSCEAPAAAKGGGVPADSMCQSMPSTKPGTLAQVWSSGGQCSKPYSSKPKYSQEGARMSVKGNQIDPAPNGQTDCSGFVSGVLARAGMRLQPGKELSSPTTTAEMVKLIEGGGSCFDQVSDGLLPGDMVVYNEGGKGHVYLIDRISAGGPGSCEFSIIESSGGGDAAYGGPRVVVKGGESGGAAVSDAMGATINRMSKSCVAKDGKDVKVGRFNPNKPGCKGTPKQFKNEACVKSCPDLGVASPEIGA